MKLTDIKAFLSSVSLMTEYSNSSAYIILSDLPWYFLNWAEQLFSTKIDSIIRSNCCEVLPQFVSRLFLCILNRESYFLDVILLEFINDFNNVFVKICNYWLTIVPYDINSGTNKLTDILCKYWNNVVFALISIYQTLTD